MENMHNEVKMLGVKGFFLVLFEWLCFERPFDAGGEQYNQSCGT